MNWRNYSYLQTGTSDQRKAYKLLTKLNLFNILDDFDPALISTVCVDLHTDKSDLDIICQVKDTSRFKSTIKHHFADQPNFKLWNRSNNAIVTGFDTKTFPIEIYCSPKPVEQQYGWRHLNMMRRVLSIEPELRAEVRKLKRGELSTEKAFARLLDLEGNPYEAFLKLEEKSDNEIRDLASTSLK